MFIDRYSEAWWDRIPRLAWSHCQNVHLGFLPLSYAEWFTEQRIALTHYKIEMIMRWKKNDCFKKKTTLHCTIKIPIKMSKNLIFFAKSNRTVAINTDYVLTNKTLNAWQHRKGQTNKQKRAHGWRHRVVWPSRSVTEY